MNRAIQLRAKGAYAYEADRLRLRMGPLESSYEFRSSGDVWKAMPWLDGLPAMDQTLAIVPGKTQTERLTPMGLVDHSWVGQSLYVDPDSVLFRTGDKRETLAKCVVDRVERLDGRAQAVASKTGEPVQFRCADGRSLLEDANAQGDLHILKVLADDPFAERVVIDDGKNWIWTRIDLRAGHAAHVDVLFKGEKVNLDNGRFSMDNYLGLAAPFQGRLELVADNGWWRHPTSELGLFQGERSPDITQPRSVTAVTSDRLSDTRKPVLCLRDKDGAVVLDETGSPSEVESCAQWRGAGGFWQYRADDTAGPTGLGNARNGPTMLRKLEQGRFADLVATGTPVPTGDEGALFVPTKSGVMLIGDLGVLRCRMICARTLGGLIPMSELRGMLRACSPQFMRLWSRAANN